MKRIKLYSRANWMLTAALQQVLREQLNEEEVLLGKQLVKVEDLGSIVQLHFNDGSQVC